MAEEKELNPSPAEVEGESHVVDVEEKLGTSYGTLSPNPKLEDKTEDGGRGTPVHEVVPPRENTRSFDDVVVFLKKVIFRGEIEGIGGADDAVTEEELRQALAKVPATIETSNIQALTDEQLDNLKVGDVVQKKTGSEKHCYIVTYKQEKHGICLSYFDGSGYIETVSYDYTEGHWVYNSTDVKEALGKNEDIQVEGITSKGIANTGGLANIGNVAVSGNLDVTGYIHGSEIVEQMEGYSFSNNPTTTKTNTYVGVVKTGNKITFVLSFELNSENEIPSYQSITLGDFYIPSAVGNKLYPNSLGWLDIRNGVAYKSTSSAKNILLLCEKISATRIRFSLNMLAASIPANEKYVCRYECTFLLSENLVPQGE